MANPLHLLPQELRGVVGLVSLAYSEFGGLQTSLCVFLAEWNREQDVPVAEMVTILRSMLSPERAGEFRFAAELRAAISGKVAESKRRAKANREQAEQRKQAIEEKNGASPLTFAELAAKVGGMPN